MVQGHGRDNLQHELELGHAAVTSAHPSEVVRNALAALADIGPMHDAAPSRGPWENAFGAALSELFP